MFNRVICALLGLICWGTVMAQEPEAAAPPGTVTEDSARHVFDLACAPGDHPGIQLSWKATRPLPAFFSIERSEDGRRFEAITVLNNVGDKPLYQWIDEAPRKGKNFYRIRYALTDGPPMYSATVSAMGGAAASLKFYPNPVDHILIVRSDAPIDVAITDATGRTRISEPRIQGLYPINVSALEKGIYLIRFSNKLTNVISQEKLMKN